MKKKVFFHWLMIETQLGLVFAVRSIGPLPESIVDVIWSGQRILISLAV